MARGSGRNDKDGRPIGPKSGGKSQPKDDGSNKKHSRKPVRASAKGLEQDVEGQDAQAIGRPDVLPLRVRRERAGIIAGMTPRSKAIVEFIERLTVPSGKGQGEPFVLLPFQLRFISEVYGPVDAKGLRKIRRALLSIGRKNGKTALAAALVLVHLIGPEAKPNSEVYSAATDRNQAGHIFKMAAQMIELDPELSSVCNVLHAVKRITVPRLGAFYASLSADARRQHGFNPSFVIYDELAQAFSRELYDVLATSFGAQEEGLLLAISTQSSDPLSVMSELADDAIKLEQGQEVDPTFYGIVYRVPDDVDVYNPANWHLANPALDVFRVSSDVNSLALKAQKSPAAEASFRNLICNQRVDGVQAFVNSRDWKLCQRPIDDSELIGRPCYGGLDLSRRKDLTAFTLAWELADNSVAIRTYFWTPQDELKERAIKDGAPYQVWADKGFLTVVPGRIVAYSTIVKHIWGLIQTYKIKSIAYDRWKIPEFKYEITRENLREEAFNLVEFGQGFKDMAPAIDKFEALVVENTLWHDGNPVMTYCLSNVSVISDPAGNRKFDKRQKTRRIDGAVSTAMALSAITLKAPEAETVSVYETRGLRVL